MFFRRTVPIAKSFEGIQKYKMLAYIAIMWLIKTPNFLELYLDSDNQVKTTFLNHIYFKDISDEKLLGIRFGENYGFHILYQQDFSTLQTIELQFNFYEVNLGNTIMLLL